MRELGIGIVASTLGSRHDKVSEAVYPDHETHHSEAQPPVKEALTSLTQGTAQAKKPLCFFYEII